MQEPDAIIEPLIMLVKDVRIDILFALLILAAIIDHRTYRIPNWLTAAGAAAGLMFSAGLPLTSPHGLGWALGGMLTALLLTLPLYALRAMGAGDVKLMAMTGTYLGVHDAAYAVLVAFIVGGVAALIFGVMRRALGRMFLNIKSSAYHMLWSAIGVTRPEAGMAAARSVGRLPFGVSIAVGAIGYVAARQLGFA